MFFETVKRIVGVVFKADLIAFIISSNQAVIYDIYTKV